MTPQQRDEERRDQEERIRLLVSDIPMTPEQMRDFHFPPLALEVQRFLGLLAVERRQHARRMAACPSGSEVVRHRTQVALWERLLAKCRRRCPHPARSGSDPSVCADCGTPL